MTDVRLEQLAKADRSIFVTELGISIDVREEQSAFVASIDNQRVAYNTVEKSYRGCFENVKSCRFNIFNFI